MDTLARTREPLPPVHGSARWLGHFSEELLACGVARLKITTATGTRVYWVQSVTEDGQKGFRLTREDTGEEHWVDTTFGPEASHWTCSCRSWSTQAHRRPERCCRHTAGLYAALKFMGLLTR